MWGQVSNDKTEVLIGRIIPTRVGTSRQVRQSIQPAWDHPHACGDKSLRISRAQYFPGSSPRVWGQAALVWVLPVQMRIIPTRVGTRHGKKPSRAQYEDHPHACGDKLSSRFPDYLFLGSSPRVWGQEGDRKMAVLVMRIIPTRVGTSCIVYHDRFSLEDHPHACGDKDPETSYIGKIVGSSPRVWGQDRPSSPFQVFSGIIPTRVGTSCSATAKQYRTRDHPHACGDKQTIKTAFVIDDGSSPRVWGQVCPCCYWESPRRIIPTRVGTRVPLHSR